MTNQEMAYRAADVARSLKAKGFFDRVAQGDVRAASLFARLVAYTMNPGGDPTSVGFLKKTAGGFNVDGFADGAIAANGNANDFQNVIKVVTSVGVTSAGIGDAVQERRPTDIWFAPVPLSLAELRYLNPAYEPATEPAKPQPQQPQTPQNPAQSQSFDASGVMAKLADIHDAVNALNARMGGLSAQVADVRLAQQNGLAIELSGKLPYLGNITLKGVARG